MTNEEIAEIESMLELEFLRQKWAKRVRARYDAHYARLDALGTAKPLTRLVAHIKAGDCVGHFTKPFALEDVQTGARTRL